MDECTPLPRTCVAAQLRTYAANGPAARAAHSSPVHLKLSVGSGIEAVVSMFAGPIKTVHFEKSTDRLADSPAASRSLS